MKIRIDDVKGFTKYFLSHINKINKAIPIRITPDRIYCFIANSDTTLYLYCEYEQDNDIEGVDEVVINLDNVNTFIKLLNTIKGNSIEFKYDVNKLVYNDGSMSFKFHLLDPRQVPDAKLPLNKFRSYNYDFDFKITYETLKDIIKASSFASDTEKLYFSTKNGCVYAEIDDKTKLNRNSFKIQISDTFNGNDLLNPIPINIEHIRNIVVNTFDETTFKINDRRSSLNANISYSSGVNVEYLIGVLKK